jgi:hypothetical protein
VKEEKASVKRQPIIDEGEEKVFVQPEVEGSVICT